MSELFDRATVPQFYGRRAGKRLRPGRRALMDTLLPKIALSPPCTRDRKLQAGDLFAAEVCTAGEIWLEVGFGGGEHLLGQLDRRSDIAILGAEPFVNGVAKLLSGLNARPAAALDRVRVFADDVRLLFPYLADSLFDRIFVLFPDPWPKSRHARRRFIGPDTLPDLARLLKPGGRLRVASDDMGYIRWSLLHLADRPDFAWTARGPGDWRRPPADWVATRYETKAIRQGRPPAYLDFRRL